MGLCGIWGEWKLKREAGKKGDSLKGYKREWVETEMRDVRVGDENGDGVLASRAEVYAGRGWGR